MMRTVTSGGTTVIERGTMAEPVVSWFPGWFPGSQTPVWEPTGRETLFRQARVETEFRAGCSQTGVWEPGKKAREEKFEHARSKTAQGSVRCSTFWADTCLRSSSFWRK